MATFYMTTYILHAQGTSRGVWTRQVEGDHSRTVHLASSFTLVASSRAPAAPSMFVAAPPPHATSEPSMRDILACGNRATSSEWTTETRSQFCSFVVPAPALPPGTVMTPYGPAVNVSAEMPPPMYGNWMPAPSQPLQQMYYPPQQPPLPSPEQAVAAAEAAVAAMGAGAASSESAAAVAPEATTTSAATAKAAASRPTAGSHRARSASPKPRRAPFHTYGRANTKPTAGGFLYGDYLATHNATVGRQIRRTRRPTAHEMGGAQVHYMEADMRHTHSAHYQPPPHPEPPAAPDTPQTRHEAEHAAQVRAAARAGGAAVVADAPAAPSTPYAAPPSAADLYAAALPAYDPNLYASSAAAPAQAPGAGVPYLPYYPVPVYAAAAAPAGAPAFDGGMYQAAPHGYPGYHGYPPQQQQQQQLVPFVPDAMGARLDPRRYKFAPRFATTSIQAAGMRCVRRDNLVA